ncbi:MAG: DUF547 domain-containing protein [Crocinitomicaceae bacterium]|nr:DUF547 domain-containing protein [Crocinitomicaceae bacterium]
MKLFIVIFMTTSFLSSSFADCNLTLTTLSHDFLIAVKIEDEAAIEEYKKCLYDLSVERIEKELDTDAKKITFWVNIYNAFIQDVLKDDETIYAARSDFFGKPSVPIAGRLISFDWIEHGILRRSKVKLSMGYLNKIFVSRIERALSVEELDYRIHFALNCGAKACPPIAAYELETIDELLDIATKSFVSSQSVFNEQENSVTTTMLFSWFRADFGGMNGIKRILAENLDIPHTDFTVYFEEYDWTLELDNYRN